MTETQATKTVTHPDDLSPGDEIRIEYDPIGFDVDSHDVIATVEETRLDAFQIFVELKRDLDSTLNSEIRLEYVDEAFFLQADMHDTEGFEYRSRGAVIVERV